MLLLEPRQYLLLLIVANSYHSIVVLTTRCEVSLSPAFLYAVWTQKFWSWTMNILINYCFRPGGSWSSNDVDGRSVAAMKMSTE